MQYSSFFKSLRDTLSNLHSDLLRYVLLNPNRHWLIILIGVPGMWISLQYRFSRWIHYYCHIPILRQILKVVFAIFQKMIQILTGAEIPNRATIGKGLVIPHTNGIVIHMDAQIGENCNLSQQVTIGIGGRAEARGTPKIGDRVFIAPGAKLFGPMTIGEDVAIGANGVGLKEVPDNAVVVGVPATVISYKGSRDFVLVPDKTV